MLHSPTLTKDITDFVNRFKFIDELEGKSLLITGCTGLIGSLIIKFLCALKQNIDIRIIGVARNEKKAKEIFGDLPVEWFFNVNLESGSIPDVGYVDYVIHCASPTSSSFFITHPVETYLTIIEGTKAMLEFAKREGVKSMVHVSSIEYYGSIEDKKECKEKDLGFIEPYDVRSSYSLGKRVAESLCYAYSKEYDVAVKVARLTQVFGAGVSATDNRVFAQFAKSVVKNQDIELHTEGKSSKPYCYTTDAIDAIFHILLKGKNGEAYNVANPETYISIKDLAELVQKKFNPGKGVVVKLDPNRGYAPDTILKLNIEKLMSLGWIPNLGMEEMFVRLIEYLRENSIKDS